ncbi:GNAT family N-acetyltransferase [Ruegeria sediminis]|uniref:GNAT family N-acetyltransferase n=1 Tax=Ruegeria sediminis TaxID=2583820 RepID=UPI001FE57826|nr:GNAT family N-acetyltransferase [Ruegeria sediminis]
MSDYHIRTLASAEVQRAVDWAAREGWNPGLQDAECFRVTDPDGFLGGFLGGEMIASVSVVNYDDSFAFLGFYIVRPEYRGAGHGLQLFRHAMTHGKGRNVGLDGVVDQQENYRRSDFDFAYNNCRFGGTVAGALKRLGNVHTGAVQPLSEVSGALKTYDRMMFPAPRDAFLASWLGAAGHHSRVCLRGGDIKGYATLRPCLSGYKVGPLFADDAGTARALLASVLGAVPEGRKDQPVFIDMPAPNARAFDLAGELGLEKSFETVRMYTGDQPDIDLSRIYGVTTFELG